MERPQAEVDYVKESADLERNLDLACARVFSTTEGALVLDWLRYAFINAIHGPDATDGQLRHREGSRFAVASIMTRIERGKKSHGTV